MQKLLDIGCGEGFNSYSLSRDKGNDVIGIDLSSENIITAKKRYPKVIFIKMNAEKLKFKKEYFDEIYAMDVLEHVDNLNKVLDEISRVSKPEAIFVINIPYFKSEYWLLKIRPTFHKEIHHVRVFKKDELENKLKNYKFSLRIKKPVDFLQHIELYFLFKRNINSKTQVSIGSWRDNYFTMILHVSVLYFNPAVLKTPLIYFPIWIITLPVGYIVNFFGNKMFPRSLYYEFIKK